MKQRMLGKSGLQVSASVSGAWGCQSSTGRPTRRSRSPLSTTPSTVVYVLRYGDMYGRGHNEELVGKALLGHRDQVVLATKFGVVRTTTSGARHQRERSMYARRVMRACGSGYDYVDCIISTGRPDTPIEETVGGWRSWSGRGKCATSGLSEASPHTLRRAMAVHPIAALQTESTRSWSRDPEDISSHVPRARHRVRALQSARTRFPDRADHDVDDLAPDDFRRHSPRFQGENYSASGPRRAGAADGRDQGCTPRNWGLRGSWRRARNRADPRYAPHQVPRRKHHGGGYQLTPAIWAPGGVAPKGARRRTLSEAACAR